MSEAVAVDETEVMDPDDFGRTGEPGERAEVGRPYVKLSRLAILVTLLVALGVWQGPTILLIIGGILVMIFFHELGHFVMARRAGMKVTEFMIGFGPRIASFRRGEVEYGLKSIPAGAYVKIIGMADIEEVPVADEPRTYREKGYAARFGVAVAGSTMHFLMALVLIGLSFVFVGTTSAKHWAVDSIAPDSAAAKAGVRKGDLVISVDGTKVATHAEMAKQAQRRPGETVPVVVRRDGHDVTLTASITPRFIVYGTNDEEFQVYGTDVGFALSIPEQSRLLDAGLRDGDVVRTIDGTPVTSIGQIRSMLDADDIAKKGSFRAGVVRADAAASGASDATVHTVVVDLGSELATTKPQGFFGVGEERIAEKRSVAEAIPASLGWFWDTTKLSVTGMARFFSPANLGAFAKRVVTTAPGTSSDSTRPELSSTAAKNNVSQNSNRMVSIVGAVALGEGLTDGNPLQLLAFFAFLNMAIGWLNLIPLPPFDGGHVAVATYERIRELIKGDGKRYFADYNKLMPIAIAVVSIMAVVGVMATYLDLADPIRL